MTDDSRRPELAELDQLLDQERQALLDGHLSQIAPIMARKAALLDAVGHLRDSESAAAAALRAKAAVNQTLLDGTLQGIRSAAARLSEVRRVRRSLETYDSRGRKKTIDGTAPDRMERRA
jgi:flagellar biosynthesis/type III secretory pathway chaperone